MGCARTRRPRPIIRRAFRQSRFGLTLAALALAGLLQPPASAQTATAPTTSDLVPGLPGTGFGIPTGGGGGLGAIAPGAPSLALPSPLAGLAGLPTTGIRGPAIYFEPSVGLSELLTDNVRYTPTQRMADSVTTLSPTLSILTDTPRTQGQFTASINYAKYLNATDLDSLYATLYSSSVTTVVPDTFFLDLKSSLSEASATGGIGFTNVAQLPQSQLVQVFTTTASPYYRKSFGDLANAELRYTFTNTSFSGGSLLSSASTTTIPSLASNSTSNEGTLTVASGPDFQRFSSRLTLDATKTDASFVGSTSLVGYDDLQYAITDTISATARLGYEQVTYPDFPAANFRGPTYLIGGQAQFGPRGFISLQYGEQFGVTGITGSGHYDVTPKTTVSFSITQGQSTTQQQIGAALGLSALTPGGVLINQNTGLPSPLVNPLFGLQNTIFTYQTLTAGVTSVIADNTLSLFASYSEEQAKAGGSGSSTGTSINLNWSRQLNPDLTGNATIGYTTANNPTLGIVTGPSSNTDSYSATVGLNYLIGYNLTGSVLYSFLYQTTPIPGITLATAQTGSVTVNQLLFTITRAF
jgi:uncharacterized protein (PEP-CTERM system associated)